MRVCICWSNISGYMAACWRRLAESGIDLQVLAYASESHPASAAPFDAGLMQGIPHRLLTQAERIDGQFVRDQVASSRPDVVVICGWSIPAYRQLLDAPELRGVRFVLTMDTPWRGELRQYLARFALRRLVRRVSAVFVPGERGWQYARRLGFEEGKIHRGVYGIDYPHFNAALEKRIAAGAIWPRSFLYAGRYEHVKGLDVLLAAYVAYRSKVQDPWGLTCCGAGTLGAAVDRAEGVTNLGFVQPVDQPAAFAQHGAFVIASRYEPWGVALAEAAAAGLPICCTEACNAGLDAVRSYYNGVRVSTGDIESLTRALCWFHAHSDLMPVFGRRSAEMAAAFDASVWTTHWSEVLSSLNDRA